MKDFSLWVMQNFDSVIYFWKFKRNTDFLSPVFLFSIFNFCFWGIQIILRFYVCKVIFIVQKYNEFQRLWMDPFFEYLKIWFLSDKPQDLVDQKWNEATMPIARFKCTLNYVSSHPTVHTAIEWAGFESGIFYINWKTLFEKLKNTSEMELFYSVLLFFINASK